MLEKYSISRVNLRIKLIVIFFTVFKIIWRRKNFIYPVVMCIYIYILLQDNERISNYVWNKEEINGTMMFTLVHESCIY